MSRWNLSGKDAGLSILTAILIVSSFPKNELPHLIWIAFLPYLIALQNKSPKQAFGLGFIVGFVTTACGSYWILHTLREFGRLPLVLAIPLFFVFCLFNNLHFAIFGWLLRKFSLGKFSLGRFPQASRIIFIPIAFTVVEYLFPQVFSWYLGACLYKQLWLIQPADITGVYGFSFLIVCVNVAFFEICLWVWNKKSHFPTFEIMAVGLLIAFSCIYSHFRSSYLKGLMSQSLKIRAGLIQTNIGNLDKFESSHGYPYAVQKTRQVNKELVLKASKTNGLDLIVLPETAAPGYFTEDQLSNRLEMFHLASQANAPLAFGGYYKTEPPLKIYNTLFLISPLFQVLGWYDKVNLLPFGEYIPLSNIFTFLKNIVPTVGDFSKGEEIKILPLRKDISFAPLICLEAIYPNFVRQFIKKGARFIVTITNDSWFGDTAAPYQHRMLHVWRTIENRAPMLRAANTGVSTFIDLRGNIQSETPLFQEAILVDDVAIISEKSFYTKFGDWFVYVLMGLFAIFNSKLFFTRKGEK